jgi:integrase/recombinase XerD
LIKEKKHQEENQGESIQTHDRGALIEEYVGFKKQNTSLVDSTLEEHKRYLNQFFDWLDLDNSFEQLSQLNFYTLQKFVVEYGKTSHSQEKMHTSLRSFLIFCHIEDHLPMDLSASIQPIRKSKRVSVPFIIDNDSLDKLLESIDRSDTVGKRDAAILEILLTYGVRGAQIRRLKLEDLFWYQSRIFFRPCKGGLAVEEPLVPEVSNALQDYLLNVRPKSTDYREVFLTIPLPFRPLTNCALSCMVDRRLQKAKIQIPDNVRVGSALFRHAFASRLLNSGTPLSQIADMLGHRNQNSTLTYTKINFKRLINVAQEWPEELS